MTMTSPKNLHTLPLNIPLLALALTLGACNGDDSATSDTATESGTTDDPTATNGTTTDGTTTDGTTTDDPTTTTEAETETEEPAAMTMIRVIHLSPDAPAVDVYANNDAAPAFPGLEVKEATDYLEIPAGTYTFSIAAAGTSLEEAVFTTPALDLAADTMYSAVAVGKLAPGAGDGGFNVIALVDSTAGLAAGEVRLQVLHAAAAAPFATVDVWNLTDPNNPEPLIPGFDFEASGSLDVPSVALVIGLDVDADGVPDATFDVPALPGDSIVNVAAFSDENDAPSLQAAVGVGALTQIDPN